LIPGAGLDSHAYRCRELLSRTRVFEVDRPATLAFKRRRVDDAVGGPPPNLTYVPMDIADDLPAALIKDEPWLFGFPVGGEHELLAELGLTLRELLTIGSEDSAKRYLTKADGTTVGAEGHAKAEALRKAAQTAAAQHLSDEQRQDMAERMREQERQMAYRIAEAVVVRR
jgi:hypothetical protein